MRMKKKVKQLLSIMLIATMLYAGIANEVPKQIQAATDPKELAGTYLSVATRYLNLGSQSSNKYNFNIKKEARKEGAKYFWYVVSDKGTPASVMIDKNTGIVTAKMAGTAYIRCKITYTDGTVLRPEGKVVVRNNITEVSISNAPSNLTIPAGTAYNFNRTILNTATGKGAKTQGITRWEISNDTSGIDNATSEGVIFPIKEGEFKIRAVCFQSVLKYKLWLADKEANISYITASSKWVTVKVDSSNGTATASTQEQLNKLLVSSDIGQITLSTTKALKFIIPKGNYNNKTLLVNTPNADVENYGVFKGITINAIKDNTWIEYADGNIVYLSDEVASFVIDEAVNVKQIVIDREDAKLNIMINGTVDQIIVLQSAQVNFSGIGAQVPVTVEATAGGSTITSSMPLNLELRAQTNITLNQGSEDTRLDKSESKVVVKIENNTNEKKTITTNNGSEEAIGAGQSVISDGSKIPSNPVPPLPIPTHTGILDNLAVSISLEGTLNIALVDLDLATTTTPTVKVTSGTDTTGQNVTLTWNSGTSKFEGTILVSATAGAGKVRAAAGETITVTYQDAANESGSAQVITKTTSVPVPTHTGILDNLAASISLEGTLNIALVDLDLATTTTLTVKVTSGTDTTGQNVTLTWNSGTSKFEGTILVSATAGAGKVRAAAAETITVTYQDAANASGSAQVITKTTSVPVPTHTGILDNLAASISLEGTLNIALVDLDLATTTTPTVKVTSGTDTTGQNVTLTWNSGTSKFEGTILVSATAGAGKVRAAAGETITVTYQDAANASGSAQVITKTTSIPVPTHTGILDNLAASISLEGTLNIALVDLDLATTTTPTVKVTSGTDTTGQNVTLTWNSGTSKFEGTILVSATAGAGRVRAAAGETITVTYQDAANASGSAQVITKTTSVPAPTHTGVLGYLGSQIVLEETLNITLQDLDLATSTTPIVKVKSTITDTTGQDVTLNWNSTTSQFEGTIVVSATPGAGKIQATCQDSISVTYQDAVNNAGIAEEISRSLSSIFYQVGFIPSGTDFGSGLIVITFRDNPSGSSDAIRISGLDQANVTIYTTGFAGNVAGGSNIVAGAAGFGVGNNTGSKPYITIELRRPGYTTQSYNFTVVGVDGGNLK